MTCCDCQREYFFNKLDEHFPGVKKKYVQRFGGQYSCNSPHAKKLYNVVNHLCEKYDIVTQLPLYKPQSIAQLSLFS